jgi:hypothetical protein
MENLTFKKSIEEQRFEFLLYINGNIICQRYFNIRGFNENSIKSLYLKYTHDYCVDIIKEHLKAKTVNYLWEFFNPYKEQTEEEVPRGDIYEKEDVYGFEIRVDKKSVIESKFTGNVYPPKVRYQVDIKEIIPKIISEIREGLSQKNYSNQWGELEF